MSPVTRSSRRATAAPSRGDSCGSWPPEQATGRATSSTRSSTSAATASSRRPPAGAGRRRARSRSSVSATRSGSRPSPAAASRNLERTPWVSVVIAEGDGDEHRAVAADGPVTHLRRAARRAARALGGAVRLARRVGRRLVRAPPERALTRTRVPEGDTLHRAAARLQPLVGQRARGRGAAPARAGGERRAEQLDGRRLESVEAVGKNLVLRFEGGVVLRSHLRMSGRWSVQPRGAEPRGRPWLVLRGDEARGRPLGRAGARAPHAGSRRPRPGHPRHAARPRRDARAPPPRRPDAHARRDAPWTRRLVAGIGNIWMAETLWEARLSPWLRLGERPRGRTGAASLETAATLMRAAVDGRPRAAPAGLPPRRPAVPALRDADPRPRAGRRQPHRLLVPCLPARAPVGDRAPAA